MRIRFRLSAAEMRQACQRLRTQLPHAPTEGNDFIAFKVAAKYVKITVSGSSEGLAAAVQRKGKVSIPCTIFHGVVSTLPYFRERTIEIGFDDGRMSIGEMVFHNHLIVLSDPPPTRRPDTA